MNLQKTIVIDNGAHTIKVGYAHDENTLLEVLTSTEQHPNSPIKRGVILDWEAMKSRWDFIEEDIFNYGIVGSNVLITDSAHGPMNQRLRIMKIMFDNYLCANLSFADPGVLALNSFGHSTGICVDSGYDKTRIVPVLNGEIIPGVFHILPIGGQQLENALFNLIKNKSEYLSRTTLVDIKEKLAYVYVDVDGSEAAKEDEVSYTLPDGQMIKLKEECFQCPEVIFDPKLIDLEGLDGLPDAIMDTVKSISPDLQKQLLENVVLSGGTANLRHFRERLEAELKKRLANHIGFSTRVLIGNAPKLSAWKGGALRASLSRFSNMCISQEEYDSIAPEEDPSGEFIGSTKGLEDLLKTKCYGC